MRGLHARATPLASPTASVKTVTISPITNVGNHCHDSVQIDKDSLLIRNRRYLKPVHWLLFFNVSVLFKLQSFACFGAGGGGGSDGVAWSLMVGKGDVVLPVKGLGTG